VKILFLTQFFDPEPTFKGLYFAKALMKRGHKVVVLTGFPNYPGGKIYPGYNIKAYKIEKREGIKIIRVALYPSHDKSSLKRAANYLSFMASSIFFGVLLSGRPNVIYCYHPPATSGIAAAILSKIKGVPFVYDIQDLWPDSVAITGMLKNNFFLNIIKIVCEAIYKSASHITVLSPGFRNELMKRGVPSKKISVIYNWCEEASLIGQKSLNSKLIIKQMDGKFNITFAGNMGIAQSLDTVLEAAEYLQKDFSKIQFNFIGGGIDKSRLQKIASDRSLKNVVFFQRLDPVEIGPVLEYSDVLLVHLKRNPLFRITIPSKIQAYLCVGKPILAALEGDAANLVLEAEAGIVCSPENPRELAKSAVRFYEMAENERLKMGKNSQRFYYNELSIIKAIQKFEEVFTEVVYRN
jgi:glycosyltransferase involved in cell wall biosynthesis